MRRAARSAPLLGAFLGCSPDRWHTHVHAAVFTVEVRLIINAVISLISSIVGGLLVLAGQFLAHRAEDRRQWLLRLHEAAGDLATSYLQEAARVNDSRRSGRVSKDDVDTSTYVVDRQKALGRFRTLP